MIPLADIEAVVRQDPHAPDGWAVYADALDELGEGRRAAAVRAALAGSPHTPEPGVPQEAAWWYGHWRAVRVRAVDELAEALAQPWARFLEEIVVADEVALLPADLLVFPPTLTRLHLEGATAIEGWPGVRQLLELHAPAWCPSEPLDAPELRRVVVAAPGALLSSAVPSLQRLEIRAATPLGELAELVASPLGPRLRVVQVRARDLAAAAAILGDLDVTVDVVGPPEDVPARVRRPLDVEGDVARYLRLEPPATDLAQRAALYDACEALGLGVHLGIPPVRWVRVPPSVARPLATAMAARAGCSVRVLELRVVPELDSVWLDADGEEVLPDGSVAPIEFDLTRAAREAKPLGRDEEDEEGGGWDLHYALEALAAVLFTPISGARLVPLAPNPWRPDPWALVQVRPGPAPRALHASQRIELSAELGRYLRFRVGQAGASAPSAAPDLARWTPRLLRRHGLDAPPDDAAHPFWAEWWDRTRPERLGDPQPGHIPSHKLSAPGRWVLAPEEVAALARALDEPIEHHEVPPELADGLDAVLRALAGAVELEVR